MLHGSGDWSLMETLDVAPASMLNGLRGFETEKDSRRIKKLFGDPGGISDRRCIPQRAWNLSSCSEGFPGAEPSAGSVICAWPNPCLPSTRHRGWPENRHDGGIPVTFPRLP